MKLNMYRLYVECNCPYADPTKNEIEEIMSICEIKFSA